MSNRDFFRDGAQANGRSAPYYGNTGKVIPLHVSAAPRWIVIASLGLLWLGVVVIAIGSLARWLR